MTATEGNQHDGDGSAIGSAMASWFALEHIADELDIGLLDDGWVDGSHEGHDADAAHMGESVVADDDPVNGMGFSCVFDLDAAGAFMDVVVLNGPVIADAGDGGAVHFEDDMAGVATVFEAALANGNAGGGFGAVEMTDAVHETANAAVFEEKVGADAGELDGGIIDVFQSAVAAWAFDVEGSDDSATAIANHEDIAVLRGEEGGA